MIEYSFIIPVYNCETYLLACVESICALRLNRYEIVMIDDGSTDGSGTLCDTLSQRYDKIRVVHQSNAGASAARNRGIKEAAGEKLIFVDADDSFDTDALRQVLSDPKCDNVDMVIFGMTFDFYHHGKCYRQDPLFYSYNGILSVKDWGLAFADLFMCNSLSPLWNKVFRRDVLQKNELLLNENMFLYEDLEFVLRYMQHCDSIWNVPKAIYHYRQSEDEGNAKRRLARIDSISDFLKPIETSLEGVLRANPAVSAKQAAEVLQQLYLILAAGKISTSSVAEIRNICEDFRDWAENRLLPQKASRLQQMLMDEKVFSIYLNNKKTALRHKIAVRVKAFLKRG